MNKTHRRKTHRRKTHRRKTNGGWGRLFGRSQPIRPTNIHTNLPGFVEGIPVDNSNRPVSYPETHDPYVLGHFRQPALGYALNGSTSNITTSILQQVPSENNSRYITSILQQVPSENITSTYNEYVQHLINILHDLNTQKDKYQYQHQYHPQFQHMVDIYDRFIYNVESAITKIRLNPLRAVQIINTMIIAINRISDQVRGDAKTLAIRLRIQIRDTLNGYGVTI